MQDTKYNSAITVRDGKLMRPVKSVVKGKRPSATLASELTIISPEPALNALIVSGQKTAYTLKDSRITLSGIGTNDFLGTGAGVLVRDHATLLLDGVTITTNAPVSSASVAAEGATLRIHNSRTYIDHSTIEADGWGALSTDAAGGNLYLEANDSVVKVRRAGYGAYADFGAHVVLNRTVVTSGAHMGIIAGKARMDFNTVSGRATQSAVMIHSVMAFDPTEAGLLSLTNSAISTGGPVLLVKSANAVIAITGGSLKSDTGVLMEVRKNADPNATQTRGAKVPGVRLSITGAALSGDVIDTDSDRETKLELHAATLAGALSDVTLSGDAGSHWVARAASTVSLAPGTSLTLIDAPTGVRVTAKIADMAVPIGETKLPSGGTLLVVR
jgi:hypothetical protein